MSSPKIFTPKSFTFGEMKQVDEVLAVAPVVQEVAQEIGTDVLKEVAKVETPVMKDEAELIEDQEPRDELQAETSEKMTYFTVGRSGCGFTIRQAQANNQNKIPTILCGDPSVLTTMTDDFASVCKNLPNLPGVPANFTCVGDIEKDLSNCSFRAGFDPMFGKM